MNIVQLFQFLVGHSGLHTDQGIHHRQVVDHGNGRTALDDPQCPLMEMQDQIEHTNLLFERRIGIHRIHGVLLEEALPQQTGRFQDQTLLIRQRIRTDQLDDLRKAALLAQNLHGMVAHLQANPRRPSPATSLPHLPGIRCNYPAS